MADGDAKKPTADKANEPIVCGIVMPISAIGDCSESHWTEVFGIVSEALEPIGFRSNMVSGADEVTVIQKTIVQNLYDNPIVIVDVSERNPNVMFELGMRLAFDKPTIIVKDDRTSFVFDTGLIEHLEYPRDLRFSKIVDFKKKLAEKVLATHQKQVADPAFSTFLKHFGQFKVASIEKKEVSGQEFIIDQLSELQRTVAGLSAPFAPSRRPLAYPAGNEVDVCCGPMDDAEIERLRHIVAKHEKVKSVRVVGVDDHLHLYAVADVESVGERRDLESTFRKMARTGRVGSRRRATENLFKDKQDRKPD